MGSYHTDTVTVRVLQEVTVIFEAPRRIVVIPTAPPARQAIRFSIPWPRKGDYTKVWKHFRKQMWRQKRLTLNHCIWLASRSGGVITMSPLSRLELDGKTLEVKHGGWSVICNGGQIKI